MGKDRDVEVIIKILFNVCVPHTVIAGLRFLLLLIIMVSFVWTLSGVTFGSRVLLIYLMQVRD